MLQRANIAPDAASDIGIRTPITPPGTKRILKQLNAASADSAITRSLILNKVDPYIIAPGSMAGPSPGLSIEMPDVELIVQELLQKTVVDVPQDSTWNPKVGVGESFVDVYTDDGHGTRLHRCSVPAVTYESFNLDVQRIVTDDSLLAHMLLQATLPHAYIALAIGLHERVKAGQGSCTCTVMDAVMRFVKREVLELKAKLNVPRPQDEVFSEPRPLPLIDVPAYQSYPAGHAALMGALHGVLMDLTGAESGEAAKFEGLPRLIYGYRMKAGLHTSIDNQAGWELGIGLAEALRAAEGQAAYPKWSEACAAARAEW